MVGLLYPDVEALLTQYLRDNLVDIPVSTNVPTTRPEEFVILERTGGVRMNQVADRPQITLETWALNEERAYEIMQIVRAYVEALQNTVFEGTTFYRMQEFGGPRSDPDPDSEVPRYIWTFAIGARGTALIP